jgi:O-antigen/teichoic acid export membrane protein
MLTQVFNAVLQGMQRFDIYSKIFNANSFALLIGNIVLAFLGYELLILLIWNLLVMCIFCAVFAIAAKKLLPEFGISFRFRRETLVLVLRYSLGIIGYQILANVLLLFERGWIARQLGAESLTYYVIPMSLGMYMHGFISSLTLVFFPLASELKDDKEKLLRLYTKATKIVSLLVVFFATTLIVENKVFLTLWMGGEFAENSSDLLILHTITFGLAAILTVSWQMTEGLGFPNYNFVIFSVCLIVSVSLMIVLTRDYGNLGIAAARLAGFAAIFLSIFYIEKRFFYKVQAAFWLKLIGSLTIAAVFAGMVESSINSYLLVNWPSFILSALCGGLVYCFVLWLLGFITADEKLLIRGVFNR